MNGYSFVAAGSVVALVGLLGCTTTVTPDSPAPGCSQDSSVAGCTGASTGYSCGNGDTPDQTDSSLVCSDGTLASDGFTLFCCIQFSSSTCTVDPSVVGCTGSSFGFSCTGNDSPDEADSSLLCSTPTEGNGELLYCCTQ